MADLVSVALAAWRPPGNDCGFDLVGMSLGGLVATCLAATLDSPRRVCSLTLLDMTPGAASGTPGGEAIRRFISSGQGEWSFEETVQRALELSGGRRSEQSLRVGIWHNARRDETTGLWRWRYDARVADELASSTTTEELWAIFDAVSSSLPVLLVHGAASQVVSAEHVTELRTRRSGAHTVLIQGGHTLHSDTPGDVARIMIQHVLER
jgi:pimeloyl-ACP methyl ester carboxylesterase